MAKLWRSLRLWFATLPRIRFRWSRPARSVTQFPTAQIAPPAAVQNEVSEYMQLVIDQAFADALQANREALELRLSDGLPPRPKRGDHSVTFALPIGHGYSPIPW